MHGVIVRVYRFIFARRRFYKFNKVVFRCALRGLGVLNYESDKLTGEKRFLLDYVRSGSDFVLFDVGANVGRYSRAVLEINKNAIIYAFEPHPINYERLSRNITGDNVHTLNMAVGNEDGNCVLYDYRYDDGSTHASVVDGVIEQIHHSESTNHVVPIARLDTILERELVDHVDLLKIDVEGGELDVLRGIKKALQGGKIKAIQFEFNEMNVLSRVFMRDFIELLPHFTLYRMAPYGLIPLGKYDPVFFEIFAFQNIAAVLGRIKEPPC